MLQEHLKTPKAKIYQSGSLRMAIVNHHIWFTCMIDLSSKQMTFLTLQLPRLGTCTRKLGFRPLVVAFYNVLKTDSGKAECLNWVIFLLILLTFMYFREL